MLFRSRFIPNGFIVPESKGVNWNDITPRMSAAYALTKDGKTALKVSLGKYVDAQDGGGTFGVNLNPTARLPVNTVTRAWNDANRDYNPDCDLLNPLANGECGADSNLNFGKNIYTNFYDDNLIHGWGVRPFNYEFSASAQREILPRVGLNVAYFRRWFGNFVVTDNRAIGPEDFSSFSITAPADSRLPNGGGYTIDGFVNVNPNKFGQENNLVTSSTNYGKYIENWQGVDINLTARGFKGVTLSGGLSTGRTKLDQCEVTKKLPEMLLGLASYNVANANVWLAQSQCARTEPYLMQFKMLGSYVIPHVDVLISGTIQSNPGPQAPANFNASNAVVSPSLGRPLSGNAANVAVNIATPGDLYGVRTNQVDLRFAKVLRFGTTRTNVGIDLYNALNANPVTAYNFTYGPRFMSPLGIMPARFLKFSAQIDW